MIQKRKGQAILMYKKAVEITTIVFYTDDIDTLLLAQ